MNGTAFTMVFVIGFFIVFACVFLAIGYVWARREYKIGEAEKSSIREAAQREKARQAEEAFDAECLRRRATEKW